jgi:hypothetical protein
MRRLHVCLGRALPLAFSLTFGQKANQAGEAVQFLGLTGDDVGQVVYGAGQVGDAFFGLKGVQGGLRRLPNVAPRGKAIPSVKEGPSHGTGQTTPPPQGRTAERVS